MAEAVAADGAQSKRQDVAQVASHELGSGDGFRAPGVAAGSVLPGKGDALIIDGEEARVADGCAANVGAEVFDGVGPVAQACTTILVTDESGRAYHGRTLEFSVLLPMDMTYFPAGTKVASSTPSGNPGLTFDTKYPILGMSFQVLPSAKQVAFAEGINDQGVSFSANWLNGTESPAVGQDDSRILAASDFGAWVLGNFKSVEEVKQAMTNGQTEIWVPVSPLDPKAPLPLHYAINDKTGNSIVVEFTDGKAHVYDNPVGVLTNGPEFPWHLQNRQNYTFTNVDKNTGQLGKLKDVKEVKSVSIFDVDKAGADSFNLFYPEQGS